MYKEEYDKQRKELIEELKEENPDADEIWVMLCHEWYEDDELMEKIIL